MEVGLGGEGVQSELFSDEVFEGVIPAELLRFNVLFDSQALVVLIHGLPLDGTGTALQM